MNVQEVGIKSCDGLSFVKRKHLSTVFLKRFMQAVREAISPNVLNSKLVNKPRKNYFLV